jgi:DNA-binding NarL/FixJ family response regulator
MSQLASQQSTATTPPRSAIRPQDLQGISPEEHAIKVLCVDDHALLIDGLEAQFAIDKHIVIVGRLSTASGLVAEARRLQPHAVLLDIEMPGPDIFEVIDTLRHTCPNVRVIILSAHATDAFVSASFAAGACAYLTKTDDIGDLITAIREVMRSRPGTYTLSPKLRERFQTPSKAAGLSRRTGAKAHADGSPPTTPLAELTGRQLEILRLIGKGLPRTEIAKELSRSVKTIDGHQERMMKKLRVTTRAELLRLAIREGLSQA